jgi:hypothetical protein
MALRTGPGVRPSERQPLQSRPAIASQLCNRLNQSGSDKMLVPTGSLLQRAGPNRLDAASSRCGVLDGESPATAVMMPQ